nr:hypothetical protein CFP56_02861 [Quercus suber]
MVCEPSLYLLSSPLQQSCREYLQCCAVCVMTGEYVILDCHETYYHVHHRHLPTGLSRTAIHVIISGHPALRNSGRNDGMLDQVT